MNALSLSWAEVEAGMRLDLPGGVYVVDKAKSKGKLVKVTMTGKGGTFTRDLKAKERVTIARREALRDAGGKMNRWAEQVELDEILPAALEAGDPRATKAPSKAKGGEWSTPADKAEKSILKGLPGASLVGATGDALLGWYVPTVDPSTLAAHLYLFHGFVADTANYAELVAIHEAQHARVAEELLAVNHWHTKERPLL